jgi:hypothetical protein
VLEEVGVQLLVFHGGIGLHVVAELLDLQIQALGLELGLDKFRISAWGTAVAATLSTSAAWADRARAAMATAVSVFLQHGGVNSLAKVKISRGFQRLRPGRDVG